MAQSNFEKRIDTYEIESTNVMTGDRDRSRYLILSTENEYGKGEADRYHRLISDGIGCADALK